MINYCFIRNTLIVLKYDGHYKSSAEYDFWHVAVSIMEYAGKTKVLLFHVAKLSTYRNFKDVSSVGSECKVICSG